MARLARLSRSGYAGAVTTYVLVPGTCHGGWWYDDLGERLDLEGHRSRAATLASLEDAPRVDRLITLDTHIDQVSAAVTEMAATATSRKRSCWPGIVTRVP